VTRRPEKLCGSRRNFLVNFSLTSGVNRKFSRKGQKEPTSTNSNFSLLTKSFSTARDHFAAEQTGKDAVFFRHVVANGQACALFPADRDFGRDPRFCTRHPACSISHIARCHYRSTHVGERKLLGHHRTRSGCAKLDLSGHRSLEKTTRHSHLDRSSGWTIPEDDFI
jgi:hypothetical protein